MKIAITADVHLTSRALAPERFNALESILGKLPGMAISDLVIAGDLFDKDQQSFSDFEALCQKPEYQSTTIHIIRGNHDKGFSSKDIVADNVRVYDAPQVVALGADAPSFLMIPYEDVAMGEKIESASETLEAGGWILIGHGDYAGGQRESNPYEKGVYMPLARSDVGRFKPLRVFLGHIHKKGAFDRVQYPGSPCGLDINETGKRSFIVYDTSNDTVTEETIETDILWYTETLTLIPSDDEVDRATREAESRVASWGLSDAECAKARIRVQLQGYAQDRSAVHQALTDVFSDYSFYDDGVNASGLEVAEDERRREVASETVARLEALTLATGEGQPDRDEILLAALQFIYGS